jgi:hypothetical protein
VTSDDIGKGTCGLGLNYPGFGLKYFLSNDYALEAKAQFQDGNDLGGLRLYRYFRPDSKMFLFLGVESDYVRFKGDLSKGSGYFGEVFAGIEYFMSSHFALSMDAGPAYVSLKDQNYSLSASGMEYVLNVGINYYFGKGH